MTSFLRRTWTWEFLALTGVGLIAAGLVACTIALTVKLLPYDVRFLGMTADRLCSLHGCRIVHFMVHDRISFGGSIAATGIAYVWLACRPLARGERWAFFALLGSGALGFMSFLTYLGFGYLDVWHERATLLLLVFFVLGLVRTYPTLRDAGASRGSFVSELPAEARWPAVIGWWLLLFTATGLVLGGLTIMTLGMTTVFVPTDLVFMNVEISDLRAVNDRLVPLIAHDRAGFGGGLASAGVAIFMIVLRGVRAGERDLWWVLLAAGGIGFATAIGAHPLVGYLDFFHLLPALVGGLTFAAGIALLAAPMRRTE
jgi:hypothetical protein